MYYANKTGSGWNLHGLSATGLNYLNVGAVDWNQDGKTDAIGMVEYPDNMLQILIQP